MATYTIYGTNQPYDGRVVELSGNLYTTFGGALEGNSYQVITQLGPGDMNTPPADIFDPALDLGNQDTVTTFVVGDNSIFGSGGYFFNNGITVPNRSLLHHHTIIPRGRLSNFMTQHTMDDNAVDVFTSRGLSGMNDSLNLRRPAPQAPPLDQVMPELIPYSPGDYTVPGATGGFAEGTDPQSLRERPPGSNPRPPGSIDTGLSGVRPPGLTNPLQPDGSTARFRDAQPLRRSLAGGGIGSRRPRPLSPKITSGGGY